MKRKLVIATRGSQLALWQAEHVKARLLADDPALEVGLNVIKTSGDLILDVPLSKVGGKGLFVKEIEQALLDGAADLAVHSMKDVPPELAPGLELCAVSTREVPWDALCARAPTSLADLPRGARIGTSSMRRQCQLLARRPDLKISMLRGNVPTRLRKLDEGDYDAIVLAAAGLTRLGLAERITYLLPAEESLPAVAQGVLGLEVRAGDAAVRERVRAAMHDAHEEPRVVAERAFLAAMGGSCETPLAAHAIWEGEALVVDGLCGMPDGSLVLRGQVRGAADEAPALGVALAKALRAQGADDVLKATAAAPP
ncbi:MAG: hydroxymethylbilane synthase [Kofleriaceae bacterium]